MEYQRRNRLGSNGDVLKGDNDSDRSDADGAEEDQLEEMQR